MTHAESVKKWFHKNKEKRAKYNRKYRLSAKGKKVIKVTNQRYYAKFPERRQARALVNAAERDGRLEIRFCCEKCGGRGKLEKHHEDYREPLVVIWLCRSCHGMR